MCLAQKLNFILDAGIVDDHFEIDAFVVRRCGDDAREPSPIHGAGEGNLVLVVFAVVIMQVEGDQSVCDAFQVVEPASVNVTVSAAAITPGHSAKRTLKLDTRTIVIIRNALPFEGFPTVFDMYGLLWSPSI